jgi:hypothetical protein
VFRLHNRNGGLGVFPDHSYSHWGTKRIDPHSAKRPHEIMKLHCRNWFCPASALAISTFVG